MIVLSRFGRLYSTDICLDRYGRENVISYEKMNSLTIGDAHISGWSRIQLVVVSP